MKKVIASNKAPKALGPYSQAVKVNDMVFTSGQIGVNPTTGELENGIEAQTRQALENIKNILEEVGFGMNTVVKCTCILKDMNDFAAMNAVYGEFFTSEPPARATFQACKLPKDAVIEIDAVAVTHN